MALIPLRAIRSSPQHGVAQNLLGGKKLGIIHFDRHVDTQETDLDERMHSTGKRRGPG